MAKIKSGDSILFEGYSDDFTISKKGKKYTITALMQDGNFDAYSRNQKNGISTISAKKLIRNWDKSFGDSPAPTAIEYTDENGQRKTSIFNIDKPSKTKQGIEFEAKVCPKKERDNMIHEFGHQALKHSDPVTGSFKNGKISIDGTDDDKQMAMDGKMYEVFMPSLTPSSQQGNDYVMPANAYAGMTTPLTLHPNKGWMGGMIFSVKGNNVPTHIIRNGQYMPLINWGGNPGSVPMWNQAYDYENGHFITNTFATPSLSESYPKSFIPPESATFPIISYGMGDGKGYPNTYPVTLAFGVPELG